MKNLTFIRLSARFYVFITLFLASSDSFPYSDEQRASEYGLKGAYMEKILNYIDWPVDNPADDKQTFKIAVLGENPFGDVLESIFAETRIQGKNIKVQYVSSVATLNNPNILFISNSFSDKLSGILDALEGKPVFIIGDTEGFCERGVFLNFYIEDDFLRFELNEQAIRKAGFSISFQLVRIAKIVNSQDGN